MSYTDGDTERAAMAAGIGMIHQHFSLVDAMTVTENIMLGWDRAGVVLKPGVIASKIKEASRTYGLAVNPGDVVAELSFGQRQRVLFHLSREHHRGVGREVAMRGVARRLDRDAGVIEPRQQRTGSRQIACPPGLSPITSLTISPNSSAPGFMERSIIIAPFSPFSTSRARILAQRYRSPRTSYGASRTACFPSITSQRP